MLIEEGESADDVASTPAPAAEAPAAAAPAAAPVAAQPIVSEDLSDPEIPEGTEMRLTTVREALRDAMAEEMRADNSVFLMGEEVAEYQAPIRSAKVCWTNSAPSA